MVLTDVDEVRGKISRALNKGWAKPYQKFVFWRAMRRYLRNVPHDGERVDPALLQELIGGWANPWSARTEFLEAAMKEAQTTPGPILECGSGLSTLLVGAIARERGVAMYSLEHEPKYSGQTQQYLRRHHLPVRLVVAPLRSYGDFDWYALPQLQTLPNRIALVICDGPPGGTRGGRFGLVPVLLEKLRPDVTILLDDGGREAEMAIAERWAKLINGKPELIGTEKPYIRLQGVGLPQAA
jgi:hypothetical protein